MSIFLEEKSPLTPLNLQPIGSAVNKEIFMPAKAEKETSSAPSPRAPRYVSAASKETDGSPSSRMGR